MYNFSVHPVGQFGEVTGDLWEIFYSFIYFEFGAFVTTDHKT